jgi:hypothetical protein
MIFAQASLDHDPPTFTSCIAGVTGAHHHTHLVCLDGVSLTFCLGWPPKLAVITGVTHHAWPLLLPQHKVSGSVLPCTTNMIGCLTTGPKTVG